MANIKALILSTAGKLKQMASTDTIPTNNLGTGTANSTTYLRGDQTWATPAGGPGGMTITEYELDFGNTPVTEGSFVITDAGISGTSKIIVQPSGNVATSRVGNDYSWETFSYSATSGTGNFTLYANCSNGSLVGKRKIYYTFS